jgi:hypothetical protein
MFVLERYRAMQATARNAIAADVKAVDVRLRTQRKK